MTSVCAIGIDPGLVHTGAVELCLNPGFKQWSVRYKLYDGISSGSLLAVSHFCMNTRPVFIEAYQPRSHWGGDKDMISAISELKRLIPGAVTINNTGVKQVVTAAFMDALKMWAFPLTSHHQDLRAAARICLYGMLKDDAMNRILAEFIQDYVDGNYWEYINV